jgi:hypothetical protein
MWWSISGLILQLLAGVLLALPYISPGKMQELDEDWHSGRGKQWLVKVIWAVMIIVLLIISGTSIYSDSTNHDVWFAKLFGVFSGVVFPIFVWMYFVNLRFGRLIKRLPTWLQQYKYAAGIRYEKYVSANRYICIWALIGWVVLSGAMYVMYAKKLVSFSWLLVPFDAFCFSTFLLAGLYLVLNMVVNLISKRFKKPLWTTILAIFIIGCVLQIVGIAVVT